MVEVWLVVVLCIVCALAGLAGGYFLARYVFKKQLEKNPPINENMIRALYMQMGRKPSEAQIRQIMNSVNKQKK